MKTHSVGQSIANHRPSVLKHVTKSIAGLALGTGLLLSSCTSKEKTPEQDSFSKEETEVAAPAQEEKSHPILGIALFSLLFASAWLRIKNHPMDADWGDTSYG